MKRIIFSVCLFLIMTVGCIMLVSCNSAKETIVYSDNTSQKNEKEDKPVILENSVEIDGLILNLNNDKSAYIISDYVGNKKDITLPSSYSNIPVNVIGERAFTGNQLIEKINIPNSFVDIGKYAFYECRQLENIIFSNGLKVINDFAFYGCEKLQKVAIPDSVDSMGASSFGACIALKEISIPFVGQSIGCTTANSYFKYIFGSPESLMNVEKVSIGRGGIGR